MRKLTISILVLAAAVLAAVGAQSVWLGIREAELRADAARVDIGGRSIHLSCGGSGGPTYVLEAGAVGVSDLWQWVRAGLQEYARVCAYDRAGIGASDPSPDGFVPAAVRRDLKAALDAAGERGPFVLVGHSLGGIFVRAYAAAYPADVAALVLVDPAQEEQRTLFDAATASQFDTFRGLMQVLPAAARLGLLHLWSPLDPVVAGLDGRPRTRALFYLQSPVSLAAGSAELQAWDAIIADRWDRPVPRSIPVLVVSAGAVPGRSAELAQRLLASHREFAAGSTQGEHDIVAAADHFSILSDRTIARDLVSAIRGFIGRTAGR